MNTNLTELNIFVCYESKPYHLLIAIGELLYMTGPSLRFSAVPWKKTNSVHTVPARAVIYSKKDILIRWARGSRCVGGKFSTQAIALFGFEWMDLN